MYKHKKIISMLVLFSILCTTLFSYPIFASEVTITLNYSEVSVEEGGTVQLTATTDPAGLDIDWYCGDGDAEVSSNGLVTGITAGNAEIIVTVWDDDGNEYTEYCTVYVYKPDGVYYIKNLNSNYYLNVENGGIESGTNVNLTSKISASETNPVKARQMWKLKYLDEGMYSIRPLHMPLLGLDLTDGNVDVWNIGNVDSLDQIGTYAQWSIVSNSSGYLILNENSREYTMQIENGSTSNGANVIASNYINSNNCRWIFESISNPSSGAYLYDEEQNAIVTNPTVYVAPKETRTLNGIDIVPIYFSENDFSQSFYWISENNNIATVDPLTGAITGQSQGTTRIIGTALGNSNIQITITINVTAIPNGVYYIRNKQTDFYVDIYGKTISNGAAIVQNPFAEGNSQKWIFTHLGNGYYSIGSMLSYAFYISVNGDSMLNNASINLINAANYKSIGKQWKLVDTNGGAYKIISKSGENGGYVLSLSTSNPTNNGALIQGTYTFNSDYRDEWYVTPYLCFTFYGIVNEGHSHYTILESLSENGSNPNWFSFKLETEATSAAQAKNDLKDADIFISRSHGISVFDENDNIIVNGLLLNDQSGSARVGLYSGSFSNITSASDWIRKTEDYSNLKLVVFIGCNTALGLSNNNDNICEIMEQCGAQTIVGFVEEIDCDAANRWTQDFYLSLLNGFNVDDAITYASGRASSNSGLHSAVSYGDGLYELPI